MIRREGDRAVLRLGEAEATVESRQWIEGLQALQEEKPLAAIAIEDGNDLEPDNLRVTAFLGILDWAEKEGIEVEKASIPDSFTKIHQLARSVRPYQPETHRGPRSIPEAVGLWAREQYRGILEIATFTGEYTLATGRMMRGKAAFPWNEIWRIFREVTVQALPIVSLISFLIGLIIAFLGAVVLMRFGAEFAVSYLVGYGMLREMGAVMTAVIMAGRTGAAYAAQIGSMKVNEELDALQTFGISPIDFIVLPRLMALTLAMPLLTLYANVVGIFGGLLVAEFMMDVPGSLFFAEMQSIVGVSDFLLGIFKAFAFGLLVSTAGCLRGLQSGRGASAVGEAATRAVVTGITLIIIANALIDWAAATYGF